jgi:hypothetical protein
VLSWRDFNAVFIMPTSILMGNIKELSRGISWKATLARCRAEKIHLTASQLMRKRRTVFGSGLTAVLFQEPAVLQVHADLPLGFLRL